MKFVLGSSEISFRVILLAILCGVMVACGGSSTDSEPWEDPVEEEEEDEDSELSPFETRVMLLDQALFPIDSTEPMSALDDLTPLSRVAQARVVGLGEATHGTREFFQLKHKIFRWLVEEYGVTVFAIEASVSEGVYLDRYVQTGEGDLEAIMMDRIWWWAWSTEEIRDLIQWMADYNASNPLAEPLRYFGVDCGPIGGQPDLIIEYFSGAAPAWVNEVEAVVGPHRGDLDEAWERYPAMELLEYETILSEFEALRDQMVDEKAALVEASSSADYRLTLYLLDSMIAGHKYYFLLFTGHGPDEANTFRDRCMADSVIRLEELVDVGVRVAYWGHNWHISSSLLEDDIPYAGYHLRQDLGNEYRSIGFSLSHGQMIAIGQQGVTVYDMPLPPKEGSVAELFHAAPESEFILDLGALPGSELLDWLRQPQYTRTTGSAFSAAQHYVKERVAERYDVIIHVDESTPSVRLE